MDRDHLMKILEAKVKVKNQAITEMSASVALLGELKKARPDAWIGNPQPLCDKLTPDAQTPLNLAAENPQTVKQLLRHGADVNQIVYPYASILEGFKTPLLSILLDVLEMKERKPEDKIVSQLLQSAKILVSEGADLHVQDSYKATLLHLAAKIRNLKFFKKLCVSGDWDVHAQGKNGMTPLHYLFLDPPPKDTDKIQEVLSICRLIVKMKRSDKDEDLVNTEDRNSKNALAYAALRCFKEGVELLIELGTDIYDEDDCGANCFHYLANSNMRSGSRRDREVDKGPRDPEIDLTIANILLKAGLDISKTDIDGRTPLYIAILNRNWHLVSYFLAEYAKLKEKSQDQGSQGNPLLWKTKEGGTIFHALADAELDEDEKQCFSELFHDIATILADFTDIHKFMSSQTKKYQTALHFAVTPPKYHLEQVQNFEAIKCILAISPEVLKYKDINGSTALDIVGERIGANAALRHRSQQQIQTNIDIFNYLLSKVLRCELSFSLFTESLLKSEKALKSRFDVQKVIEHYNAPFKDKHGWGLFDYLSVNGILDYLAPHLPQKTPSSIADFAQPSKFRFRSGPAEMKANLLEDGLGEIKFNFGAEPFEFEEANDPGWQWDWRKAEAEWGEVYQNYKDV
ncbi:Inversin [Dactylellina cionopaga]|nr:Inversin [Dactylellina cionopaga]